MAKNWYVLHTYSGHENKVKSAIESKFKRLGMDDRLGEIKIPTYDDPYLSKDGKKKMRSRKTLPGYVLISMEWEDETWAAVKSIPGVTNFVGSFKDGKPRPPKPLSDHEVNDLLFGHSVKDKTSKERVHTTMNFSIGEPVKVVDGPFSNFNGVVEEVFPDKGRLRVKVEIFGRGTPVEFDYLQVSKM
jgi:transcription termination/antitermination protein NusG